MITGVATIAQNGKPLPCIELFGEEQCDISYCKTECAKKHKGGVGICIGGGLGPSIGDEMPKNRFFADALIPGVKGRLVTLDFLWVT